MAAVGVLGVVGSRVLIIHTRESDTEAMILFRAWDAKPGEHFETLHTHRSGIIVGKVGEWHRESVEVRFDNGERRFIHGQVVLKISRETVH